jgi:hypothetical protein
MLLNIKTYIRRKLINEFEIIICLKQGKVKLIFLHRKEKIQINYLEFS